MRQFPPADPFKCFLWIFNAQPYVGNTDRQHKLTSDLGQSKTALDAIEANIETVDTAMYSNERLVDIRDTHFQQLSIVDNSIELSIHVSHL